MSKVAQYVSKYVYGHSILPMVACSICNCLKWCAVCHFQQLNQFGCTDSMSNVKAFCLKFQVLHFTPNQHQFAQHGPKIHRDCLLTSQYDPRGLLWRSVSNSGGFWDHAGLPPPARGKPTMGGRDDRLPGRNDGLKRRAETTGRRNDGPTKRRAEMTGRNDGPK